MKKMKMNNMNDNELKAKCNCGNEASKTFIFGKSSMSMCNKCAEDLTDYLFNLAMDESEEK